MTNSKSMSGKMRQELFISLYEKAFPSVARYVAKMGGSFDDAKDIFQDALLVYYEKVTVGQQATIITDKAYLYGIARNLWHQRYNSNRKEQALENIDFQLESEWQLQQDKVLQYLQTAGEKCMNLLKAFYYDALPLNSVKELFGYSGLRSATVAKYKCLEKVRETIKIKSISYADFLEEH